MNKTADLLFNYLRDIIYDHNNANLDTNLIDEEFKKLAEGLIFLKKCLDEQHELAISLSKGDLNIELPSSSNALANPLKSLHANLKHLTWQTKQVARGDYSQRVNFMGEFSNAFNTMIICLNNRQKELETHAFWDSLTNLHNRFYITQVLNRFLKEKQHFSLCFMDLDNLKYINDTFGHTEGDQYLINVAKHLEIFLPDCTISRFGGDEFMILLPDLTEDESSNIIEKILSCLYSYGQAKNCLLNYSISYGIVEVTEDNNLTAHEILSLADQKMYVLKKSHKDSFHD